ncbi:MAG: hypothetical protein M3P33_03360 [bacterium]|nr:hypothetical protein [bacterium]
MDITSGSSKWEEDEVHLVFQVTSGEWKQEPVTRSRRRLRVQLLEVRNQANN